MKNRQIVRLLSHLSAEDLTGFRLFLLSPYHTNRHMYVEILDLVIDHLLGDNKALKPEEFYKKLRPGEAYNENILNSRLSTLVSHCNDFLVDQTLKEDVQLQERLLQQAYAKRNVDFSMVSRQYKKSQRRITDGAKQDASFFREMFELDFSWGAYHFRGARKRVDWGDLLEKQNFHFDNYYILRKIQMACGLHGYNRLYQTELKVSHWDVIVEIIQGNKHLLSEVSLIYFEMYELLLDPNNTEGIFAFAAQLTEKSDKLSPENLRDCYTFLINLVSRQINQGKNEFLSVSEGLFDFGIHNEILLQNGDIRPADLKNGITLKCLLGKVEEAEAFLAEYSTKLTDDQEGNAIGFNRGQIAFFKKDFRACKREMFQILSGYKEDEFYIFDANGYLIRALVEQMRIIQEFGDYQFLQNQLKNYKGYLKRKKGVARERLEPHFTFHEMGKKVFRFLFTNSHKGLSKEGLLAELEQKKGLSVTGRSWLKVLLTES